MKGMLTIQSPSDQEEATVLLDHEGISYHWEDGGKLAYEEADHVRITEILDDSGIDYDERG